MMKLGRLAVVVPAGRRVACAMYTTRISVLTAAPVYSQEIVGGFDAKRSVLVCPSHGRAWGSASPAGEVAARAAGVGPQGASAAAACAYREP